MSRTPSHAAGGTPQGAKPMARPAATRPQPTPAPAPHAPAAPTAPGANAASAKAAPVAPVTPPKPANTVAQYLAKPQVRKYGSIAVAVLLLVGLFIWSPWSPSPPRLNEDPAVIAKFAASHIGKLSFEHQRQFMELLDEKDDRVDEAYEQGQLSDQEFRRALQLAWYGEHLKKMDNFFSKPPSMRLMYLDKQVDKKRKKKAKEKDEPTDDKAPLKAQDIERDDSTEEADIKRWPADVRQRWSEYRTAWANRKQYWKDHKDQQKADQETAKASPAGAAADASKGAEAAAPTGAGAADPQ
jgi:hypothetical protein